MRWDHSTDQRLGCDIVTTKHRIGELSDFSDDGLADILDRYPRRAIRVYTMGDNPSYPNQLQSGLVGRSAGADLIDMVRRGRLLIQLCNFAENHKRLDSITRRLRSELVECQPGLRIHHGDGSLEISSPRAMSYLQCNQSPTVLWQIRGSKKTWVYPQADPMQSRRRLCSYEPQLEDTASQITQHATDMIGVPHFTPYRTVNDNSLNVCLRTRFHTDQSKRLSESRSAYHLLNRLLPWKQSKSTRGIGATAKRELGRLLQSRCSQTSLHDGNKMEPSFRVHPDAPNCVGPLDEKLLEVKPKIESTVLPPLSSTGRLFSTTTLANAASEN